MAHDLALAHAMHTSHNTHGSCSRAKGDGGPSNINNGIPIPASVAALTKRQERPPPRPLPHRLKQRLHKQGPSLHQTQWFTQIQSAGGSLFLQAPLQPLWWRRSRRPQAPHQTQPWPVLVPATPWALTRSLAAPNENNQRCGDIVRAFNSPRRVERLPSPDYPRTGAEQAHASSSASNSE